MEKNHTYCASTHWAVCGRKSNGSCSRYIFAIVRRRQHCGGDNRSTVGATTQGYSHDQEATYCCEFDAHRYRSDKVLASVRRILGGFGKDQRHENGDYQRIFGRMRNPDRSRGRQSDSSLAGDGHRTSKTSSAVRADLPKSPARKESSDILSTRPPHQHDDRCAAYVATSPGPASGLNFFFERRYVRDRETSFKSPRHDAST